MDGRRTRKSAWSDRRIGDLMLSRNQYGAVPVSGWRWPKSERGERRRKVWRDRKYLEPRSRRFLKIYLNVSEARKPAFYEVLNEASRQCFPTQSGLPSPNFNDSEIAEATSNAAMKVVLERGVSEKGDRTADFITDAYATVGVAYHRAAGVYVRDKDMQELGTAAVHLLTIATSYLTRHPDSSELR
jgi:hypothetical protein